MKRRFGEVALLTTSIIWGSGFVASAIALEYYTPYQILFIRFLIGVIILALVLNKRLKNIKRSTMIYGAIIGSFLFLGFAFQTVGLQFTTPSKNAFLTSVSVVIVPFIALVLYRRRISAYEIIGAILALTGVGLMSLQLSSSINIGDFLTLCCAFAFAFQIFYTSRFVQEEDPVLLTFIQLTVACLISFIFVFIQGDLAMNVQLEGVMSVVYLGLFSTTIAYLLQTIAQKTVTATKSAILLSTESVWGMIFSIILLKEIVTFRMIVGAILIFMAIIVSEIKIPLRLNRRRSALGMGRERLK